MVEELFDTDPQNLVGFLSEAIAEILRTEDSAAFLAWMHAEAPQRIPEVFAGLQHEQARRAFTTELGRALWNSVPLPGQGFRPRPLPRPQRNDLCLCGSGRKSKKCCGAVGLEAPDVPPFDPEVIWSLVATCLPPGRIEELAAAGKVPRTSLAEMAGLLLDTGSAESALALIEPLFADPSRLDERDAEAVAVLVAVYDELGLLETKEREIERLGRELPPALRITLWEHLSRSYAALGEMGGAWKALDTARQLNPAHPLLVPLEVSLLLAENRAAEAGDVARAALHPSRRRKLTGLPAPALGLLHEVAADPEGTRLALALGERADAVQRMVNVLENTRGLVLPPYRLVRDDDTPGQGWLEVPAGLVDAEAGWLEAFSSLEPEEDDEETWVEEDGGDEDEETEEEGWGDFESDDPWDTDNTEAWVSFLEENPEGLGVFLTLADLISAAELLVEEVGAPLDRTLLQPLVERAVLQVDNALYSDPEIRLPSEHEPNLPALELLLAAARLAGRQGDSGRQVALLDRLLHLDPADEMAARLALAPVLLERGEPQRVLDLAASYPDDPLPDLTFARILALHRLGRTEEARAALDDAAGRFSLTAALIADVEAEGWREAGRETVYTLWLDTPELMAWLREKMKL